MKFLIDEDLSVRVASSLRDELGWDVIHVRDRGMLGQSDHVVLQRAYEEDRILITANVRDFQRLARAVELHPGIILVLEGSLSRDEQRIVIQQAITLVSQEDEERGMINRVLEISFSGEAEFYDLPMPST